MSKTETNPFFKSKYFDINSLIGQLEPLLEKNGLVLLQPIESGFVRSVIYHLETQQLVASEIKLPELNDPQKLGSAITYYRRYTLQSLLGLQAEDDDANKASGKVTPKELPWLTEDGFNHLMTKGTPDEISTAFKVRRIKKEYAEQLKSKK